MAIMAGRAIFASAAVKLLIDLLQQYEGIRTEPMILLQYMQQNYALRAILSSER